MSIAPRDFWNRLVKVGITDASGCKKLVAAVRKASGDRDPSDVRKIAKRLVKSGILTTYQARVLLSERPQTLRRGQWLIQDATGPPPLSRWMPVRSVTSDLRGVLFVVKAEAVSDPQQQWLQIHQSVKHSKLQRFEQTRDDRKVYVFSELDSGCSLHDLIRSNQGLPPDQVCRIGVDLCHALEALHSANVIHGQVRCDRVWISDQQAATLLRDPSKSPLPSLHSSEGLVEGSKSNAGWLDEVETPYSYLAPELAEANPSLSPATDLYSLGCLLYRLLNGRPPVEAGSIDAAIAAHATTTPPDLAEAVAQGAQGDPLRRVIAFAMAKRPAARFGNADQFAKALQAVLPLLPKSESVVSAPPTGNRVVKEQAAKAVEKKQPVSDKAQKADKAEEERHAGPVQPAAAAAIAGATEAGNQVVVPPTPEVAVTPAPPPDVASGSKVSVAGGNLAPSDPPQPPLTQESASSSAKPRRRRKRKKNQAVLILGGMSIAVLMLMIVLVSGGGLGSGSDDRNSENRYTQRRLPETIPPVTRRNSDDEDTSDGDVLDRDRQVEGYELVSDDRLLFVPPYAATVEPSSLELLPPGPAVIATFRIGDLLETDTGKQMIDAFSPGIDTLLHSLQDRAGVDPNEINRCTVALFSGRQGWPEASLAIELNEPHSKAALLEQWQVAEARTPSGATVFAGDSPDSDAYYLADSDSENVERFAVGSITRIQEVGENEGGQIPLPRALHTLWNTSSEQSEIVILMTPNFLFADGRQLLQRSVPEGVASLKRFLIPDASAALLTATLEENRLFVEARLAASGGTSAALLSRKLQTAIESWPGWAEEFIVDSVPDVSWRLLAIRLPAMMQFVAKQFRFGVSEDSATANAYLPLEVMPQVSLASVLALNTPAAGVSPSQVAPPPKLSINQMLEREMTVSFEQESLEFALNTIVDAFNENLPAGNELPPARIIGGDLQLMGITQNQQVRDFDKNDQPLRKVLTDLVLGANPDKTATGPDDPKQALVWVIADDPDNSDGQAILITTRQAAAGKYELPAEFTLN